MQIGYWPSGLNMIGGLCSDHPVQDGQLDTVLGFDLPVCQSSPRRLGLDKKFEPLAPSQPK